MIRRDRLRCVVAVAVAAVLAAACGSGGSGNAGAGASSAAASASTGTGAIKAGLVNKQAGNVDPVTGGVLQFSEATPTLSFDPAISQSSGATGNVTLGAVYDTLMRYDVTADRYEPQMAESLTPSPDFKTWTLKLRPNVKFTDGTAMDASAVVFNLKRTAASAQATNGPLAKLITSYDTPDPLQVVFQLQQAWARFPYLLAVNSGMMISPTAASAEGKDFGAKPVGAGPFKVSSYVPQEKIELVRNPDYWGGRPYLDGISITSALGNPATLQRLQTGAAQLVFLQQAKTEAEAIRAGYPGAIGLANMFGVQTNDGKGKPVPTNDPRVRQAMAAAIDLQQLNQRVDNGDGVYHSTLLAETSPWNPGVPGPAYDPAKAKQLVDQVKQSTGWDGSLQYLDTSQGDPTLGLTLQALLNQVGFKVALNNVPTTNDLISKIFVDKDFQFNNWGTTVWDADPWASLYVNWLSTSGRNTSGYANPQLDQLLSQLGAAPTVQAAKPILAQIQTIFTQDVPFIATHSQPMAAFWAKTVHGIVQTAQGTVLLDKAFISK